MFVTTITVRQAIGTQSTLAESAIPSIYVTYIYLPLPSSFFPFLLLLPAPFSSSLFPLFSSFHYKHFTLLFHHVITKTLSPFLPISDIDEYYHIETDTERETTLT